MTLGAQTIPITEFVPGTFPVKIVTYAIREALPLHVKDWSRDKVLDMYRLYQDAVKSGRDIITPGSSSARDYMESHSAYTRNDIRVFLSTIYNLAQSGQIDQKWWNVPHQSKSGIFKQASGLTNTIEKTGTAIKWTSILLLSGVAIYIIFPFIRRR